LGLAFNFPYDISYKIVLIHGTTDIMEAPLAVEPPKSEASTKRLLQPTRCKHNADEDILGCSTLKRSRHTEEIKGFHGLPKNPGQVACKDCFETDFD